MCPPRSTGDVVLLRAGDVGRVVASRLRRASTVVVEDQHHGVLGRAEVIQGLQQAADVLIHAVHHRRVHGHQFRVPLLQRFIEPRRKLGFADGELELGAEDPQLLLPCESFSSKFVPARAIAAAVFRDVVRLRVQGRVGRRVTDMHEERSPGGLETPQLLDGMIGDRVC